MSRRERRVTIFGLAVASFLPLTILTSPHDIDPWWVRSTALLLFLCVVALLLIVVSERRSDG